jgi:hypothetical protein
MFRAVCELSWIGRRIDVWWATVRAPLVWVCVTFAGAIFTILSFVRDEILPSDVQEKYQLLNLLAIVPWYAYAIATLAVLLIVTIEGLYRQSQGHVDALRTLDAEHQDALREAQNAGIDTVKTLRAEVASFNEFKVAFNHDRAIVVWSAENDGHRFDKPEIEGWLVLNDVRITNRSDKRVPLDCHIFVSALNDQYRYGELVGKPRLPQWVLEKIPHYLKDSEELPTPLVLEGFGAAPNAFCGIPITHDMIKSLRLTTAEELLNGRALWFQVNDRRVTRHVDFALNVEAHKCQIRSRVRRMPEPSVARD